MIDRPTAIEHPRETDDVNTPLENVPRQTSIIAHLPWSLWIITDHRAERNWDVERDRVLFAASCLPRKFMTTGLAPTM